MAKFIAVFRPHQRPAWAQVFENEQEFIDAWVNGFFDRSCYANNNLDESESEHTFSNAWSDVGHDLYNLTRLDSAQEVASYLNDRNYAGHHNKALDDVRRCAEAIGWFADPLLTAAAPELLVAARCALADLEGIMPEFEPSGDREHPAWTTIKELQAAIAKAEGGSQ